MKIRVLVVDDDPIVASSLTRILEEQSDMVPVGTAATGAEAMALTRQLRPDVVLMDIVLRGAMDGVEATRRLRNMLNPPAVLAVTAFETDTILRGALEAGATGFLLKKDALDSLVTAIRRVFDGDSMVSPDITTRLINSYVTPVADPVCERARAEVQALTEREIEIATLVGAGKTYDDIAAQLHISASTVKSTIGRALNKVGAISGAQLAVLVAQARLDLLD